VTSVTLQRLMLGKPNLNLHRLAVDCKGSIAGPGYPATPNEGDDAFVVRGQSEPCEQTRHSHEPAGVVPCDCFGPSPQRLTNLRSRSGYSPRPMRFL
jgi:hypothetical protein